MAKELTHRGAELKKLGWSEQDVLRYVELWDYRQRWGAINLEREDRLFLRKAESTLPKIQTSKASIKKPLREKSYYARILYFLDSMNVAENELGVKGGDRGVWPILLEEELRILEYFQPVLGLPDALKAKALTPLREELICFALDEYKEQLGILKYNFKALANSIENLEGKNWVPLRDGINNDEDAYPILSANSINSFRKEVRSKLIPFVRNNFPSLSESDKPNPPDDWIPELVS